MKPQQIKQVLIRLAENDELPMDMNDLDESLFEEQNQLSVKEQLTAIVAKINDNEIDVWDYTMSITSTAIATEDYCGEDQEEPSTPYNGWLDDLQQLIDNL